MLFKSSSVQVRITPMRREGFAPEVYRPGVISFARLLWGSLGGGLLLGGIAILSRLTGIEVLFPPLAATCFINSTCVFLRVARPKPVIVGHFFASIGGLAGVWVGAYFGGGTEYAVACKLGFAVMFAAILICAPRNHSMDTLSEEKESAVEAKVTPWSRHLLGTSSRALLFFTRNGHKTICVVMGGRFV